MSDNDLRRQLAEAQETIRALREELNETNSGFVTFGDLQPPGCRPRAFVPLVL